MRLTDIDTIVNYHIEDTEGREWVLLPIKTLGDLPIVDAMPVVHASWMINEYGNTVCSACNCGLPGFHCYDEETDEEWDEEIDETPFCSNCGAKMDGGASDGI